MFGVDSGEMFIIVLVAVMVIGPKDLPRVMRSIGNWVGRARAMANQFRSGVDQMVRDSEIADLEKSWREQNESIMRAHPPAPPESDWGRPTPPPAAPPGPPTLSLDKEAQVPPPQPSLDKPAPDGPVSPVRAPRPAPARVPTLLKPAHGEPRPATPEPERP